MCAHPPTPHSLSDVSLLQQGREVNGKLLLIKSGELYSAQ